MNRFSVFTRTALCVGVLTALTVSGCSTSSDDTVDGAAAGAHAASSTPTATGTPRNAQGRIEKQFGESAGLVDRDTGQPAITFTLHNPRVQPDCTGFWQFTPNGVYLMMDINVETSADYTTARTGSAGYSVAQTIDRRLSRGSWKVIGPDGNVVSDLVSTASLNCDEENTDVFKDPFSPASTYQGTYVLDIPAGSTSVFLEFPGKDIGWEWKIPANLTAADATGAPQGF